MSLIAEVKSLSTLRKNQQLMSFFMLFVTALIIAYTAKAYVELFGAKGLILKEYAISLFGLILLIPALGKIVKSNPMKTFQVSVLFELLALTGYFAVNQGVYPNILLPLSTVILMFSVFFMRPLVTRVDSQVTNSCPDYSLLKSKLDSLYIALGALFGGTFVLLDVPSVFTFALLIMSIIISRYYRNLVFLEIYTTKENTSLVEKLA